MAAVRGRQRSWAAQNSRPTLVVVLQAHRFSWHILTSTCRSMDGLLQTEEGELVELHYHVWRGISLYLVDSRKHNRKAQHHE